MKRYKILERLTNTVHSQMLHETQMLETLLMLSDEHYYPVLHEIRYVKYLQPETKTVIVVVMLIDDLACYTVNYRGGFDNHIGLGSNIEWYLSNGYIPATEDEFVSFAKNSITQIVNAIY